MFSTSGDVCPGFQSECGSFADHVFSNVQEKNIIKFILIFSLNLVTK